MDGAIFINRAAKSTAGWLRWRRLRADVPFSALAFLPQKDGISPLRKLTAGRYPDGRDLYFGLLRLGVDAPGLLPPKKEEPLP